MPTYLIVNRPPHGWTPSVAAAREWNVWFEALGGDLVDRGNPTFTTRALGVQTAAGMSPGSRTVMTRNCCALRRVVMRSRRSATAIRRHQTLVNCAFSFCWKTWFDPPSTPEGPTTPSPPEPYADGSGERGHNIRPLDSSSVLAESPTRGPGLAHPVATVTTLVESLVQHAPTR